LCYVGYTIYGSEGHIYDFPFDGDIPLAENDEPTHVDYRKEVQAVQFTFVQEVLK
jgi:hypothetical protein